MTTTVKAYGATSATAPLEPMTIERRDVGAHDVLIEIDYAGICHSDIHTIRGDWGPNPICRSQSAGTRRRIRWRPRKPAAAPAPPTRSLALPCTP